MRIGAMIGADGTKSSIDEVIQLGKDMEQAGLDHVWLANIFSYDAISTLGLIARETSTIRVGTAVTPTYPRHPGALAQQAMTTAAASKGRSTCSWTTRRPRRKSKKTIPSSTAFVTSRFGGSSSLTQTSHRFLTLWLQMGWMLRASSRAWRHSCTSSGIIRSKGTACTVLAQVTSSTVRPIQTSISRLKS